MRYMIELEKSYKLPCSCSILQLWYLGLDYKSHNIHIHKGLESTCSSNCTLSERKDKSHSRLRANSAPEQAAGWRGKVSHCFNNVCSLTWQWCFIFNPAEPSAGCCLLTRPHVLLMESQNCANTVQSSWKTVHYIHTLKWSLGARSKR